MNDKLRVRVFRFWRKLAYANPCYKIEFTKSNGRHVTRLLKLVEYRPGRFDWCVSRELPAWETMRGLNDVSMKGFNDGYF